MLTALSIKNAFLSAVFALWVWLAPMRPAMGCVVLLPFIDLVLGLLCARKTGQPITSAGIKRTVGKVFLYEFAAILAFVTETWLTGPFVPVTKMVTGLIGLTELKSCLEHLDTLGGSPLFASLLGRLAPVQPPTTIQQSMPTFGPPTGPQSPAGSSPQQPPPPTQVPR